MDFADERYVRLYTRDTATWKLLNWQAKCIVGLLLRKCDRAGVIEFGGAEMGPALSALIDIPTEVVAPGVESLAERDVIELHDHWLVFPNYIDAQEAKTNDKRRAAEYRARRRDRARAAKLAQGKAKPAVTPRDDSSRRVTQGSLFGDGGTVTPCDDSSRRVTPPESGPRAHTVTPRDDSSQDVTPSRLGAEPRVTPRDENPRNRHTASHGVTPSLAEPSLAQPSPAQPDPTSNVVSRPVPSSQPARGERAGSDIPPRPLRRIGPMDAKVHVTEWEPHPDAPSYAAAIGLTDQEFETTMLELKSRLRTDTGHLGFFDDRFCSFLEARARENGSGRRRGKRAAAPAAARAQQTSDDTVDLSMLDDEDREGFGDFLAGLD